MQDCTAKTLSENCCAADMVMLSLCKGQRIFWEPLLFKINILLQVKQFPKDRKKKPFQISSGQPN